MAQPTRKFLKKSLQKTCTIKNNIVHLHYTIKQRVMKKLVYLTQGLSIILAFIGVKLLLEAMHSQGWHSVGPFELPHISLMFSLGMIIGTLALTSIISLYKTRDIKSK